MPKTPEEKALASIDVNVKRLAKAVNECNKNMVKLVAAESRTAKRIETFIELFSEERDELLAVHKREEPIDEYDRVNGDDFHDGDDFDGQPGG